MTAYKPISCAFYDRLEALTVKGMVVELCFVGEDGEAEVLRDVVVDVFSRNKEEFLQTRSGRVLRLDRITSVNGMLAEGDNCVL